MNYLFNLNRDDALRQSIIGVEASYEFGGSERYEGMTLETLDRLIENGFVDTEHYFNDCPKIAVFRSFMERYPNEGVTAHGFLISPERHDCHISVEGLEAKSNNTAFIEDFKRTFSKADEFECGDGYQRCWYD